MGTMLRGGSGPRWGAVGLAAVLAVVVALAPTWPNRAAAAGVGGASPVQATATVVPAAKCVVDPSKSASPVAVYPGGTVDLTLTARAVCVGYPLHIVLVLDRGASLGPAAFQAMKDQAVAFVDAMKLPEHPNDKVGVVSFADTADPLSLLLTNDAARARDYIRNLSQSAATTKDVAAGVRAGLQQIVLGRGAGTPALQFAEVLVLFSDGASTAGCEDLLRAAAQVKSQGVLLATTCVGANCDATCMRQAASSGRYFYDLDTVVNLPPALDRARQGLRRLTVYDHLAPGFSYVADSALPAPSTGNPAAGASWATALVPAGGITVTYRATAPLVPGEYAVGASEAEVVDKDGGVSRVPFPMPVIRVLTAPPLPAAAAAQAFLPALAYPTLGQPCTDVGVTVQNLGAEASKALLVAWGPDEDADCAPSRCPGPIKVECSGLIKPGASWVFRTNQLPASAASAMVYHVTAQTLREIGVELGFDDVTADYLCEKLFFDAVGDCPRYSAFRQAWDSGATWNGVPLAKAYAGRLVADVRRSCAPSVTVGAPAFAAEYSAGTGLDVGAPDATTGAYTYVAPALALNASGALGVLAVQNAGTECATVDLWFRAEGDCAAAPRKCATVTVQPGMSRTVLASTCGGPNLRGAGVLTSDQPLAVTVDTVGRSSLTTYRALPQPAGTAAGATLWGPFTMSEYNGWDSLVHVQNTSSATEAKVKVYFQDRSGDIIVSLVETICPLGGKTFDLKAVAGLPGTWVGSIRVESQIWWSPTDPPAAAPQLAAVAELRQTGPGGVLQAVAYELVPGFPAQLDGSGLDPVGTTMLALPGLERTAAENGPSTELAVQNKVGKPGFTDFAMYIFDQNGLLDFVCYKLQDKQVEYFDLDKWGYINRGFRGSALVSAVYWEHDVYAPDGQFLYSMVDLGAATLQRDRAAAPALDGAGATVAQTVARGGALPPVPQDPCKTGPAPITVTPPATLVPQPPSPTAPPATTTAGPAPTGTPWATVTALPTAPVRTATAPAPTPTRILCDCRVYLPLAHVSGRADATDVPTVPPTATRPRTTTPALPTGTPAATATPVPPIPGVLGPGPVFVPALGQGNGTERCQAGVSVQNVGLVPGKVVLVAWSAAGLCPPSCTGPAKVECSGIIRPGGSWSFAANELPAAADSAAVFGFTAQRGSDVGLTLPGGDDVVADYFCEQLFFGVVGDCAEYRRFQLAYQVGGLYAGVPLDRAWSGPYVADVRRTCPGHRTPGLVTTAGYGGVNARDRGVYQPPIGGAFTYFAPGLVEQQYGFTSRVFVQNMGLNCSSVIVWYQDEASCVQARICEEHWLAPGESAVFRSDDCLAPGWVGGAWVHGSEPLAVVAEVEGHDTLAAATALVPRSPSDVTFLNELEWFAPLVYGPGTGWETRVTVQHMVITSQARVKVEVRDATGQVVQTLTDYICGGRSRTFLVGGLTGSGVGTVRVVSEPYSTGPDTPPAKPWPISGRVTMLWHDAAADGELRRAASYNLVSGYGTRAMGGDPRGGALALPNVGRSTADGRPRTTVVVVNLVDADEAGSTAFGLDLFDGNGPVARLCGTLPAGQARAIDLAEASAAVPVAFRGSALVSAMWWDHPAGTGADPTRTRWLLAALAVQAGPPQAPDSGGPEPIALEPAALVPGPVPAGGLPCTPLGW